MGEDRYINTNIVSKSISPTPFSKSISKLGKTTIVMQTFLVLSQTYLFVGLSMHNEIRINQY